MPTHQNPPALGVIDLRSDTVTVPSEAMREAMARAPVGDDVYGEDPTTNRLQEAVAALLGKEAALFVPSGVMGNQLAIKAHTQPGDEVLVDSESHIFHYETAAPSIISGVQLHCVESDWGELSAEHSARIRERIRPSAYYYPRTSLLCLEQTHNRYSGAVLSAETAHAASSLAREHGLALHCDGARFWNACVAGGENANLNTTISANAAAFDSLSLCLSKGLGAPVGSVLVGTRSMITIAHKWRKILGAGMRQTGMLAAAGLYALEHNLPLLAHDHRRARLFAELIAADGAETDGAQTNAAQTEAETEAETSPVSVDLRRVQTNIVVFSLRSLVGASVGSPAGSSASSLAGSSASEADFLERCKRHGVLLGSIKAGVMRAVFHHHISDDDVRRAAAVVRRSAEESAKESTQESAGENAQKA
jgi:threonine aldolase